MAMTLPWAVDVDEGLCAARCHHRDKFVDGRSGDEAADQRSRAVIFGDLAAAGMEIGGAGRRRAVQVKAFQVALPHSGAAEVAIVLTTRRPSGS
ncbi:MAG: hypothetical protein WDN08_22100 [Rhizomicrobium sp.]